MELISIYLIDFLYLSFVKSLQFLVLTFLDFYAYRIRINEGILDDCREWVSEKLKDGRNKPFDFVPTAPFHDPSNPLSRADPVGMNCL